MPRRPQPDQADIRRRILDAALHEFSLRGYHRAILDEIAAKAGASKGAVYWYFENKRALFLAVVQEEIFRLAKYLDLQQLATDVARGFLEGILKRPR